MSKAFADHFAGVAEKYAQYRPHYPASLFEWLATLPAAHDLAWDCAAGSGQASQNLAMHFDQVIATDASAAQIATASAHPKISFRVASAEDSGLNARSVDLITVAQALHWFDLPGFYAEVRRVLKPDGVLAVWTYNLFTTDSTAINTSLQQYYAQTVGPYWPAERIHIETGYRDLPFPFDEITPPQFKMQTHWTLAQVCGYLRSWSASNRFQQATGIDPVAQLQHELLPLWGDATQAYSFDWPLTLRVGYVESA